jgi:hypothetical protein
MAYHHGNHLVICDRCGFRYQRSQVKKEWTGFLVCSPCFDPRHPQLDLKIRGDKVGVRDPRPDLSSAVTTATSTTYESREGATFESRDGAEWE